MLGPDLEGCNGMRLGGDEPVATTTLELTAEARRAATLRTEISLTRQER